MRKLIAVAAILIAPLTLGVVAGCKDADPPVVVREGEPFTVKPGQRVDVIMNGNGPDAEYRCRMMGGKPARDGDTLTCQEVPY